VAGLGLVIRRPIPAPGRGCIMPPMFRGMAWLLGLAALCSCGCADGQRTPKGPNPYRRELRAESGARVDPARIDIAASSPAATAPVLLPPVSPRSVGPSVMFVNREPITIADVLSPIRRELEKDAERLPPRQYAATAAQKVRRSIDEQMFILVVYREAARSMTEEEEKLYSKRADEEIQRIVNLEFEGRQAKFEKHLADQGLTLKEVREKTKRRLVVYRYLAERFRPLAEHPKRDELKRYYEAHRDEFTTPPRVRMSLIEVSFEGPLRKPRSAATAAEISQARQDALAKARRAREEIESGVPFSAVARAYSDGLKASAGGAWEELDPRSLRPRYERVVRELLRMSAGQVSDVLEGTDAYFIVRCESITPERQMTFEEAQPAIAERLLEQRYQQMQKEYVDGLLRRAVVQNEEEFFRSVLAAAPQPKGGHPAGP